GVGDEAPAEEEEPDEPEAPVADTTAPTVAITSPLPGAVLSGTTTATVSATDDTAVTGVAFYIGSLKVGDGVRTTGSTWSLTTSTGGMRGTFPLTARATDAAGNTTASAPVTVTLK
ncbi:Ig-like domain-containing protein, partial [Rathayibacter sp. ZW T2_19]